MGRYTNLFGRLGGSKGVVYVGHYCGQFIQQGVIAIYLEVPKHVSDSMRSAARVPYLLQKFHVLTTHPSLAELEHTMGGCRIVQDDLKDLRAEKVGQDFGSLVHAAILFWRGE